MFIVPLLQKKKMIFATFCADLFLKTFFFMYDCDINMFGLLDRIMNNGLFLL